MQPTPLPPDTRTSFLREELRTRTRRPHPARHIPHPRSRMRSARSGPRRALRLVDIRASDGRACASGGGGRSRVLLVQLLLRVGR